MYVFNIYLVSAPLRGFSGALKGCSESVPNNSYLLSLSNRYVLISCFEMLLFAAIWTRVAAGRLFHAIGPRSWESAPLHGWRPAARDNEAVLISGSQISTSHNCWGRNTEFLKVWKRSLMDALWNEKQDLESDSLCCWKPVEIIQNQCRHRCELWNSK